jgi:hypothetical protein
MGQTLCLGALFKVSTLLSVPLAPLGLFSGQVAVGDETGGVRVFARVLPVPH